MRMQLLFVDSQAEHGDDNANTNIEFQANAIRNLRQVEVNITHE